VDGFRIDVVHGLGKDPALADDPPEKAGIPHSALNDDPRTHPILRNMRRFVDAFDRDPVLVGEVFLLSTEKVAAYYGQGDELHLAFNFPPLYAPWEADAWRTRIDRTIEVLDPIDAWPTWVLSNHDNPRHRTRYGSDARARAAVLLLLGLRGTVFLYAGEELGLADAVVPPERVVDPGGRDGCRAPIPWDATPTHGWAGEEPWLPWPPDSADRNAAAQEDDANSFLWLYRRALAARSDSPGLRDGTFTWLEAAPGVLAWERDGDGDRVVVVVNFTDAPILVGSLPDDRWELVVASDPGMPGRWSGEVAAWAAVWLRPI
jgi:alpha-glucosidase